MRASPSLSTLPLLTLLLSTSSSSFASASNNPNLNPNSNPNPNPRIKWISPAGGDVYAPGSHLVGQWSVTDDKVVSPSFRLCNYLDGGDPAPDDGKGGDGEDGGDGGDGGDECGASVKPVVDAQNGTYQITLAVPNVTSAYTFLLEMEDDSGSISASPAFTFTPGLTGVFSSSLNNATSPSNASSTSPPAIVRPHHTVSPAAYAVPLCIAGAIIAIATTVGLHHRNKLVRERSLQSDELKSFKSQFTDNLGRLRGLSMWATSRSRAATRAQKSKEDIDDIFTPVYLPYVSQEKQGARRPRSTTREPFCPRRNGSGGDVDVVKGGASARAPYPNQPSPGNRRHLEVVTEEEEVKVDGGKSQYLETCAVVACVPTPLRPAYVRKSAPGVDN